MTFLIIIIALLVTLILWVIFVPVNIRVDTTKDLYCVSQAGTMTFSLCPNEKQFVKVNVFGFNIQLKQSARLPKTKERPGSKKQTKRKSLDAWLYLFNGVVKSFRCKRFECTVDFDDVVLNAQLYPALYFASHGPVRLSTNFRRENYLDIYIQVRVYIMLWTIIRFFLTKK